MAKKALTAIADAFGEVKKAAELNEKSRKLCEADIHVIAGKNEKTTINSVSICDNPVVNNEEEYEEIERKTKRVNFLLYPSVYELAKQRARKHRQTLNDYVNTVLSKSV